MDPESPAVPAALQRKSWVERVQAFFEVLLLSGIVSSFLAALPLIGLRNGKMDSLLQNATVVCFFLLLESAITLLIVAILLKAHREPLQSLGLHWVNWKRHVVTGLILVPFLFVINAIVAFLFKVYLPQFYIERNPLTEMIQTPQQLALFIFSALIAGGIKEEVQRAFIINRFRHFLGGAVLGLIVWSLAFGAGHYVQGVQGVVVAGMYGFFFGIVYLMSGSLVAPIVAHGAYDTIALLAYWFLSGRLK